MHSALTVKHHGLLMDLFIMDSWNNTNREHDHNPYIQWIKYSLLTDVQKMTSLRRGCTHIAGWSEPGTNESIKVILKRAVDGQDSQSFDFYQVNYFYV